MSFTVGETPADTSAFTLTVATDNLVLLPEGSLLVSGSGTERALTIRPAPGKTGQAKVTLTVADGEARKQTEFRVKVETSIVAGLEQSSPTAQVKVVPNPTQGTCQVLLPEKPRGPVQIQLYSPLGQPVQAAASRETDISFSLILTDCLPGVYLLRVSTAAQT